MRRRDFLKLLGLSVGAPAMVWAALSEATPEYTDPVQLPDFGCIEFPDGFRIVSIIGSDVSQHLLVHGWLDGVRGYFSISHYEIAISERLQVDASRFSALGYREFGVTFSVPRDFWEESKKLWA